MAKPTICTHSSAPAKARPAATSAPPANMMSTRSTDRISTTPSSSAAPSHQTHAMAIPFVGRPPRSYRSRTFPWGSVGAALPTAARESSAERAGAPPLAVLLNHELDAERLGQVLGGQDVGQHPGRADAPSPEQQGVREADGDLLHVVGDQHRHRRAEVAGQLRQGLQELLPPAEVQARGGFVEQQQLRIGHQRTGDLGALALALAERPERPVGELADAEDVQQGVCTLVIERLVRLAPATGRPVRGGEHDVEHSLGPRVGVASAALADPNPPQHAPAERLPPGHVFGCPTKLGQVDPAVLDLPRSAHLALWLPHADRSPSAAERALAVIQGEDEPHTVTADDDVPGTHTSLAELLNTWAREVVAVAAVLPVPGDVGGVPAPVSGDAIDAGECVLVSTPEGSFAAVPQVAAFGSVADTGYLVDWRVTRVPDWSLAVLAAVGSLPDAERDLRAALTTATDSLDSLEVAHWRPDAAEALAALRATPTHLPPGLA